MEGRCLTNLLQSLLRTRKKKKGKALSLTLPMIMLVVDDGWSLEVGGYPGRTVFRHGENLRVSLQRGHGSKRGLTRPSRCGVRSESAGQKILAAKWRY